MLQKEQVFHNRYQLKKQLGQNAARQTWLAQDLKTNEPVVVKFLAFSPQMQWQEVKLFEREANILKQLNHPRIPRYRDYFSVDEKTGAGLPWFALVQDYIPGDSLREMLDSGNRFTEKQARKIATDLLKVLIYLHEISPPVLHRDIKPSNIIYGKDSHIYLVDFGSVKDKATAEGITFTIVGTGGYAPIEQFWGRAVPASDLYALGATLIHLLTGIAPADLPQQNLRLQFSDKIQLEPTFTRWLETLTNPALERRFSTAKQALEALNKPHNFSLSALKNSKISFVNYNKLTVLLSIQFFIISGLFCVILFIINNLGMGND